MYKRVIGNGQLHLIHVASKLVGEGAGLLVHWAGSFFGHDNLYLLTSHTRTCRGGKKSLIFHMTFCFSFDRTIPVSCRDPWGSPLRKSPPNLLCKIYGNKSDDSAFLLCMWCFCTSCLIQLLSRYYPTSDQRARSILTRLHKQCLYQAKHHP